MTKYKMDRRRFMRTSALGVSAVASSQVSLAGSLQTRRWPIIMSTWDHGVAANTVGFDLLKKGRSALDAVEKGVMEVESDPKVRTVGIGGYPDREGKVTLDACIMKADGGCGAVAFLQDIKNPIAVARKVMEETPHIMLVGQGAKQFALQNGFKEEELLTRAAKKDYQEWLKTSDYKPIINIENHDTISTLAIDEKGVMAGACTTSGAAWKMHGRVGDSPIIGAGLFIDGEVGGACATGLGEEVIRTAGSAMVVEAMRYGNTPQEACETIVNRMIKKQQNLQDFQVGFMAMDKNGQTGAYSVQKGFTYALKSDTLEELAEARYLIKK